MRTKQKVPSLSYLYVVCDKAPCYSYGAHYPSHEGGLKGGLKRGLKGGLQGGLQGGASRGGLRGGLSCYLAVTWERCRTKILKGLCRVIGWFQVAADIALPLK